MKLLFVRMPCAIFWGIRTVGYPMAIGLLSAYLKKNIPWIEIELLDGELSKVSYLKENVFGNIFSRIKEIFASEGVRYSRYNDNNYWENIHTRNFSFWDRFSNMILEKKPDIVAIQCYTIHMTSVKLLCQILKNKMAHRSKIILGGPHIILRPDETMQQIPEIDYCISANEPAALTEIIRSLSSGRKTYKSTFGIYFRENGEYSCSKASPPKDRLDSLPFSDRFLGNPNSYHPFQYIFTSKGCPWKCSFCSAHQIQNGKVYYRSIGNVIDEIISLKKDGYRYIRITDDTFTVSKKRVSKFVEMLKANNLLDINFSFGARVDTIDDELIDLIKDIKIANISIGIESGSPRILKIMNKETNIDKAIKAFKLLNAHNYETRAFFLLGNPKETIKDLELSYNFVSIIKPSLIQVSIAAPLPNTLYENYALKKAKYFNIDNYYKLTSWNAYNHNISDMPDDVLNQFYTKFQKLATKIDVRDRIMKGLHYIIHDPRYVLKILRR